MGPRARGSLPHPPPAGSGKKRSWSAQQVHARGGGEPGSQPRGAEEAEEKEDLEESPAPQRHRNPLTFPVATPATSLTEIESGRRRTAPGCRWQQEAPVSLQQQDSRPGTPTPGRGTGARRPALQRALGGVLAAIGFGMSAGSQLSDLWEDPHRGPPTGLWAPIEPQG